MAKLFANSGNPDQTPHFAVSDLGLHCLPITLLWVFRLQWVNFTSLITELNKDDNSHVVLVFIFWYAGVT